MSTPRRSGRTLVVALVMALLTALSGVGVSVLHAQQPPPVPPTLPRPAGAPGEVELNRDKVLIDWAEPDSTMRELLERAGYRAVQYQGSQVRFDAKTRALVMIGKPAGVKRDQTILIGDTVIYDDSTQVVVALGDTVVLRDPSRDDSDDFVARGRIRYDLETLEGTTGAFSTSVVSGQRLFITAKSGTIYGDTTETGGQRIFFHEGDFTFCDLDEPHFHFTARDIKYVSENVVVARPGVLYIGEVPVFWLPFFFQDVRSGRRGGMLTPRFGISELLRNSSNYQRTVENIGWFFAINDYMDTEVSMDWRSGTRGSSFDPGWLRGNMDFRYKWQSRFIDGNTAVSYLGQYDGTTNTSVTWRHNQAFSQRTRLNANLNWAENTFVQRQTAFNPVAATATIASQLNYQTGIGPAAISIGGSRKQYPGRRQVDQDFPNLNVTVQTLRAGQVEWTPSTRFSVSRTDNIDQGLQFGQVFRRDSIGRLDSLRVNASRRNMQFGIQSPIKIFDFDIRNEFSVSDRLDDYPEQRIVRDVNDTSIVATRVFAQRYFTNIDWRTSFNLPRFFAGTWEMSPSVNFENVDPSAGYLVRTELSGGRYVQQSKRVLYGLNASPTFYGLFPGVGPVARFRHTIQPTVGYNLSPAAEVSDEFLQATGRTRTGYLGALPRNEVTLGFSTNIEARLKPRARPEPARASRAEGDTAEVVDAELDALDAELALLDAAQETADAPAEEEGQRIKLLALNFSSLSYDFIRADTASSGIVQQNFSIAGRSDLLPGLDFRMGYDLFQGDPLSDTAVFLPFRNELALNFSLDGRSGLVNFIGRLFGRRPDFEDADTVSLGDGDDFAQQGGGGMAAAGSRSRGLPLMLPGAGQGWRLSLNYNANRQRPPVGGTQIAIDPAELCTQQFPFGSFLYNDCVLTSQTNPPAGFDPGGFVTPGGPQFLRPPSENISGNLSFGITPKWAATTSAQYDMVRRDFGSLQVALQRELHDWDAVFSFTRAPNGNFAFNFFISLKASPEVKFNYDRRSVR